jgi:hypothetical protein
MHDNFDSEGKKLLFGAIQQVNRKGSGVEKNCTTCARAIPSHRRLRQPALIGDNKGIVPGPANTRLKYAIAIALNSNIIGLQG